MEEKDFYKPNSHKYKEEQAASVNEEKKKFEKVVTGTVRTKKKTGLSKFKDELISDTVPNIRTYIVKDVIVPAIKRGISDTVDILLNGGRTRDSRGIASKISYRKYWEEPRNKTIEASRATVGYDYDDIIFESRGQAEEVLSLMDEALDQYGFVSVADLYDLCGVSGSYTNNKYGWTSLKSAEVLRVRDGGYVIKLPKALTR